MATTVTITEPERVDSKKVDSSGKLYVGTAFSGQRIKFIIESAQEIEEPDDEQD